MKKKFNVEFFLFFSYVQKHILVKSMSTIWRIPCLLPLGDRERRQKERGERKKRRENESQGGGKS